MKIRNVLTAGVLLGLSLSGCDLGYTPFEVDPDVKAEADALIATGKIVIDGVEYSEVKGIGAYRQTQHMVYSIGPLGIDLQGHKDYIKFNEVQTELGYTVLAAEGIGCFVETSEKEEFLNKIATTSNVWKYSYTNFENPYSGKINLINVSSSKNDLLNAKFNEIVNITKNATEEEKVYISSAGNDYAMYGFERCSEDGTFHVNSDRFDILFKDNQYYYVLPPYNDGFVCYYNGNEQVNEFVNALVK